MNRMINWSL